jgi:hypothetical protein
VQNIPTEYHYREPFPFSVVDNLWPDAWVMDLYNEARGLPAELFNNTMTHAFGNGVSGDTVFRLATTISKIRQLVLPKDDYTKLEINALEYAGSGFHIINSNDGSKNVELRFTQWIEKLNCKALLQVVTFCNAGKRKDKIKIGHRFELTPQIGRTIFLRPPASIQLQVRASDEPFVVWTTNFYVEREDDEALASSS